MLLDFLLIAGIVFAVNLLPAFGPPTAAVLVALSLTYDLPSAPLIAVGALAAARGDSLWRTGLAAFARASQPSDGVHLAAAQGALLKNRARSAAGLGLFALSPVPSGQLFTAAGLMEVALVPLTAAFFAGRVVSYSIYVTGAAALRKTFGDTLVDSLTSPIGIAAQLLALIGLVLLLRLDWADILARRES